MVTLLDGDSTVTNVLVEGNTKYITITKNEPRDKLCPLCSSRLHSKGQFKRHPNDQILQDGYNVDLTVIGRRWKCSNPECSYSRTDQFDFIEKRKRNTNIIIFQILNAFKDINLSCRQIAERYHISDTFAHQTFMRYINLPRKKTDQIHMHRRGIFEHLSDLQVRSCYNGFHYRRYPGYHREQKKNLYTGILPVHPSQ